MRTVGEVLDRRRRSAFVGRDRERTELAAVLGPDGPLVVFVTGTGGIGKTALLEAFGGDARDAGWRTVTIDCRAVEPTEAGFTAALAGALGQPAGDGLTSVTAALADGAPTVLVLDALEHLTLLDTWLRHELVPALPDSCRVVAGSRQVALGAWGASGAQDAPIRAMPLGPLPDDHARHLLEAAGVLDADIPALLRFASGHPLALTIGAGAAAQHPMAAVQDSAFPAVIDALTERYLCHLDPTVRAALDAAAVVRRLTLPLLAAMEPDLDAKGVLEALTRLPFVDVTADGAFLHETFQQAVAANLAAADPERFAMLRRRAWRTLRRLAATAGTATLWRSTADMLFLVDNPAVREAFFPSAASGHVVEPARVVDRPGIEELVREHEPVETAAWLRSWLDREPGAFSVARARDGAVEGTHALLRLSAADRGWLRRDPVGAAWCRHLDRHPIPPGHDALLLPRWLSLGAGELPAPAQSAIWLDIKRSYMALRPALDRLYTVVRDLETYGPVVTPLGFRPIEAVHIGPDVLTACVLEFGAGSVDGWLTRLVGAELGDPDADADVVGLSPLERGVWEHLTAHPGRPATRAELIEAVWGTTYSGGSNVVDAVVRTLRRKLGDRAATIESVRGVGYRYRA